MASFKGIDFSERGENAQTFPAWRRKAESSVVLNTVQTSGITADTLSLKIRCTKAQLASLYGAVGTAGSLVYSYGTRTAFLDEISDPQEVLVSGKYFATLSFIGQ